MPVNVFIGSSSEGECYAKVIQDVITNLGDYEVLPWRSAFIVGEATIESLITAAGNVDAAVFVATPDDIRVMRTRADLVIHDNVLFEYGMFSGKLGRFRTALAVVGDAVRPTDLIGVTHILLPLKEEKDEWVHYRTKFVDQKVREWLQKNFATRDLLATSRSLDYKCLESETAAKENDRPYRAEAPGDCKSLTMKE
jgi:predicted nucleotide-binding protein